MTVFFFQCDESSRRNEEPEVVVVVSDSTEPDIFKDTEAEVLSSHASQCDESLVAFPGLPIPGYYIKVSYSVTAY
jgi:hypothetical protein